MTSEEKAILAYAGMDVASALERFMNNDALLKKFLKKFIDDASYVQLKEGVETRDLDKCFMAAHTLKGVAANFSFNDFCQLVSDQTEEFRAGKLDEGIAMMPMITAEYNRIIEAIEKIYA